MARKFLFTACVVILASSACAKKFNDEEKPSWAKKDVRDYTEADLERLLQQWDEDEEPLPADELPEHLRPRPQVDFAQVDFTDPEKLLKLTKKGQTVMMFVRLTGDPTEAETTDITNTWQQALWNNHIQAERYPVDVNRAIFLFKDGSLAWDAKDFLIQQERCEEVTIEGKTYHGVHSEAGKKEKDGAKDEL